MGTWAKNLEPGQVALLKGSFSIFRGGLRKNARKPPWRNERSLRCKNHNIHSWSEDGDRREVLGGINRDFGIFNGV